MGLFGTGWDPWKDINKGVDTLFSNVSNVVVDDWLGQDRLSKLVDPKTSMDEGMRIVSNPQEYASAINDIKNQALPLARRMAIAAAVMGAITLAAGPSAVGGTAWEGTAATLPGQSAELAAANETLAADMASNGVVTQTAPGMTAQETAYATISSGGQAPIGSTVTGYNTSGLALSDPFMGNAAIGTTELAGASVNPMTLTAAEQMGVASTGLAMSDPLMGNAAVGATEVAGTSVNPAVLAAGTTAAVTPAVLQGASTAGGMTLGQALIPAAVGATGSVIQGVLQADAQKDAAEISANATAEQVAAQQAYQQKLDEYANKVVKNQYGTIGTANTEIEKLIAENLSNQKGYIADQSKLVGTYETNLQDLIKTYGKDSQQVADFITSNNIAARNSLRGGYNTEGYRYGSQNALNTLSRDYSNARNLYNENIQDAIGSLGGNTDRQTGYYHTGYTEANRTLGTGMNMGASALARGTTDAVNYQRPFTTAGEQGLQAFTNSALNPNSDVAQRELDFASRNLNKQLASRGLFNSGAGLESQRELIQDVAGREAQRQIGLQNQLAQMGQQSAGVASQLEGNYGNQLASIYGQGYGQQGQNIMQGNLQSGQAVGTLGGNLANIYQNKAQYLGDNMANLGTQYYGGSQNLQNNLLQQQNLLGTSMAQNYATQGTQLADVQNLTNQNMFGYGSALQGDLLKNRLGIQDAYSGASTTATQGRIDNTQNTLGQLLNADTRQGNIITQTGTQTLNNIKDLSMANAQNQMAATVGQGNIWGNTLGQVGKLGSNALMNYQDYNYIPKRTLYS